MFKLLTEKAKQQVVHEYVMRRTIVMLLGLILVFLTGIVGLLPSYELSSVRQSEVLERTRVMNNIKHEEDESGLQDWLRQTNQKLALLSPKLDIDRPSDFVKRILGVKIKGVRMEDLSWVKVGDKINLSISGVAVDRQTLVTFENRINSSGYFSAVTLPISNLVKDKDIDFQIKFSPL